MKKLMILITVLAFWGCEKDSTDPGDGGNGNDFVTELEGTWIGNDLTWVFSGSAYSATYAVEWYQGTFSINTQTNPKQMDAVITDCSNSDYTGTTGLGIYKIEGNILTYASYAPGNTNRPTSFTDSYAVVFILTKE